MSFNGSGVPGGLDFNQERLFVADRGSPPDTPLQVIVSAGCKSGLFFLLLAAKPRARPAMELSKMAGLVVV
jgi:hypothetical protein